MSEYIPKWHKELEIFEKVKPLLILEGNILDSYQYPSEGSVTKGSILRLSEYLHYHMVDAGYKNIIFYDSRRGFFTMREEGNLQGFAQLVHATISDNVVLADFRNRCIAAEYAKNALTQNKEATAIVMSFASRYIVSPDRINQSEVDSFSTLIQATLEAKSAIGLKGNQRNLLILIVNKLNDLPVWFYLDNPNAKAIKLETPSHEEREQFIKGPNFKTFFSTEVWTMAQQYISQQPDEIEKIQSRFAAQTEGFSFTELNSLRLLCKNEGIAPIKMCDVIDLYKYGIRENPWQKLSFESLRNAQVSFEKRIKGQNAAIVRTLDVIKRAVIGLSGIQHSSFSKPKGVLFFAGPTGTGKTETAKTLAENLFGDEKACIRFDMSEYGQSHSDQRLLGAPPGYVGYEAGGQLTNAVKKNPFSILLFDEIEKAHSSILDKFLQILEDGRMTDGQGNTVYFSETVIIFTSNLGIYTTDSTGERRANVTPDMPYEEVQKHVRTAIENYFKLDLGRPEILNRIGENVVVFDFIREETACMILRSQIEKIAGILLSEKEITLTLSDNAYSQLQDRALKNLENGGRGIGNVVESMLINPLSRHLFDRTDHSTHISIQSFILTNDVTTLNVINIAE